jgi:murein DD-endopeptidase MepM/ murein hydrolase activator NlpD
MSIHISRRTLTKSVAVVGLLAAASALSGCTTMGMGSGDPVVTGSTGYAGTSNLNQPMPGAIGGTTKVAEGPYMPPEDIGSGSQSGPPAQTYARLPPLSRPSSITSQDLPVIGNAPSNGNPRAMSAQPNFAPLPSATAPHIAAAAPNLSVVPGGLYTHVIRSGESLYTIAKHYGVTAQSIMQASNIPAPDKIFVGQRVSIPGRPDLLAAMDGGKPAPQTDKLPIDSGKPVLASAAPEPAPQPLHGPSTAPATRVASLGTDHVPLAGRVLTTAPAPTPSAVAPAALTPQVHNAVSGKPQPLKPVAPTATPAPAAAQVASAPAAAAPKMPLAEPAVSGADKFRWPLTGKVIVNFASSKGTGINIAAPEGTPVRAAENGTVIYVGSGVEGYGNLVLIRHANGYVSAYANLKDMGVAKGAVVNRGDTIGSAGSTGSVSSPQLHFELRKGATPVDPIPLLAAG